MGASTVMKSRPILFSGPMVRAILDGRKTQTRRIVKPQPPDHAIEVFDWRRPDIAESAKANEGCYYNDMDGLHFHCKCPYGTVGDRLWVRETIKRAGGGACWFAADDKLVYGTDPLTKRRMAAHYQYKRSVLPSIHMPRDWCRITLEITGVRVERLQAISNADCVAEGIEPIGAERNIGDCLGRDVTTQAGRIDGKCSTVRQLYSELWTTINGPGSWAANPWIWVVSFERLS